MAQIRKKSETDNEDIISKLPDEILANILSFVSTKFAVATSVLSKRWKLIWILVPSLDFDEYHKLSESGGFENLIDRFLSLNNFMSVRNVKFYCYYGSDVFRANAWFKSLLMRDAEKFDLFFPDSLTSAMNLSLMPDSFFNQKNLVELKLCNIVLKVPPLVCFPSLKTITLISGQFFDNDSMKNLLSGCPTLAYLRMHLKNCSNKQTLCICSSTMHILEIRANSSKDGGPKVVIDAPKLKYLNLKEEGMSAVYDFVNISSLVKASMSYAKHEDILFEVLRKISHVEELLLNQHTFKLFEGRFLTKLPVFSKLNHLILEIHSRESLSVLPRLLDYTPNVVNIVLNLMINNQSNRSWNEMWDLPQSILSCIVNVEITEEIDQSMPVISCILKHETNLKKLSFRGLPLHLVHEDNYLKTFLTASHIKCRCAALLQPKLFSRDLPAQCLRKIMMLGKARTDFAISFCGLVT